MTSNGRNVEDSIKQCYSTWGTSYYDEYYGADAPYPPVHLDLVRRLVDERKVTRLLDAGCGPASMLRHMQAPGRELYGFDLTPEMVLEARRLQMRGVWWYLVFGMLVAISVTVPLFLIHRQSALAARTPGAPAGQLRGADVVGIIVIAAGTLAYMVLSFLRPG